MTYDPLTEEKFDTERFMEEMTKFHKDMNQATDKENGK